LIAIRVFVTMKSVRVLATERTRFVARFAAGPWLAHSGHLMPTALKTMQSVQIGRKQLEQLTAVSARGWR
jgi:hypothetical protein